MHIKGRSSSLLLYDVSLLNDFTQNRFSTKQDICYSSNIHKNKCQILFILPYISLNSLINNIKNLPILQNLMQG